MLTIQNLIDDAKCYQTIQELEMAHRGHVSQVCFSRGDQAGSGAYPTVPPEVSLSAVLTSLLMI